MCQKVNMTVSCCLMSCCFCVVFLHMFGQQSGHYKRVACKLAIYSIHVLYWIHLKQETFVFDVIIALRVCRNEFTYNRRLNLTTRSVAVTFKYIVENLRYFPMKTSHSTYTKSGNVYTTHTAITDSLLFQCVSKQSFTWLALRVCFNQSWFCLLSHTIFVQEYTFLLQYCKVCVYLFILCLTC